MSDAPEAAAPKKSKKMLVIVLVVLLLAGGGGGFFVMKMKKPNDDEGGPGVKQSKPQDNKPPVFVTLDDFLVNLPGRGGENFLQAKVILRVADAPTEAKLKSLMPLVRDRLLTVLSQRPMDVLATIEGRAALTRDMAVVANAILEPQLTAVYTLSRDPTGADIRNLERLGVVPRDMINSGKGFSGHASAKLLDISETDLPVQAVLFNTFVMQ